jgi:hypothetical protein
LPLSHDRATVASRYKVAAQVDSILHSVRRRQRALARVVLALFCLAWLQAAVVPCAMATAASTSMPAGAQHCPYCPQGDAPSAATDHAGSCAYPHQAQVDARAAAILFVAVPVSTFTPMTEVAADGPHLPAAVTPDPVPRIPIPLRFCRYLE